MKISKNKLYFLVKESVQKILESNSRQEPATNLYVKLTYKYKKIVSVREISEMIKDLDKRFSYINREGETVVKKKKRAAEYKRLVALRQIVKQKGGVEIPSDQHEQFYIRLDALRLPRQVFLNIKQLIEDEGDDFLFDFREAMIKNPHRAAEIKSYFGEILRRLQTPTQNESIKRIIKDLLPGSGAGVELNSIQAHPTAPEIYVIEDNAHVLQTGFAENSDKVRGFVPIPEDDGVTEYKDEDGKVIATSDQVAMLYRLANRYQSVNNRVFAASQVYAPYKVLMKLARDRNPKVRAAVAANPKAHENHLKILANDTSEEVMIAMGEREILANIPDDVESESLTRIRDNSTDLTPENMRTIEEWFIDKKKKAVLKRARLENMETNINMQEEEINRSMVPGEKSEEIGKERLEQLAIQRRSLIADFDDLEKLEAQIAEEEEEIKKMKADAEEAALSPRQRAMRDLRSNVASRRAKSQQAYQRRSDFGDASTLASRHLTREKVMEDERQRVEELEANATTDRQIEQAEEARKQFEKSFEQLQNDIRQAEQNPDYVKIKRQKALNRSTSAAEDLPEPEEIKSPEAQVRDAILGWQKAGYSNEVVLRRAEAMMERLGLK